MGHIRNLPVSATCLEKFEGRIDHPGAWTHGKVVSFGRWRAMVSKGYKTGYEQVMTNYLVLRIEGERTMCRAYSGKRLEKAATIFAGWQADLAPHMVPA